MSTRRRSYGKKKGSVKSARRSHRKRGSYKKRGSRSRRHYRRRGAGVGDDE